MKNVFLIWTVILSTLFIQNAFAQQPQAQQQKTPEQKANGQTKKWTKALALNPDQANKAYTIFLDTDQKITAIKANYANAADKKAMHKEEKAVRDQCDSALQQVFTPDQYNNYLAIKAQQKQQRQQQKQPTK